MMFTNLKFTKYFQNLNTIWTIILLYWRSTEIQVHKSQNCRIPCEVVCTVDPYRLLSKVVRMVGPQTACIMAVSWGLALLGKPLALTTFLKNFLFYAN